MSLLETRDVTMTYSGINDLGDSTMSPTRIISTTTIVTLPEPERVVCLEMGDKSLSFTMRELFELIKGLMDEWFCGDCYFGYEVPERQRGKGVNA